MRETTVKGIQTSAHLAIIFTAGLICAVLIKNYLIFPPSFSETTRVAAPAVPVNASGKAVSNKIQRGTKLPFSGIDWEKNGQTLIMALSDKCPFCSESAPFYKRLSQAKGRSQLVVVLPQSVEVGRNYLESLGVNITEIKQVSFPSVGLRGAPTLILADDKGVAVDMWVGRLPVEREAEVLDRLR